MSRLFLVCLAGGVSLLVLFGATRPAEALAKFGEPEFTCVSFKQWAAATYSISAFGAWAEWERKQDDARRDHRLAKAGARLAWVFDLAEAWSAHKGVDCVEQTLAAADLEERIRALVGEVATAINTGLDLEDRRDAKCGERLLKAAGKRSRTSLIAESLHTWPVPHGGAARWRKWLREYAERSFGRNWKRARCPTDADEDVVAARLDALSRDVVFHTTVAPGLDATEFQPISPVGSIDYQGQGILTHLPDC